ncbi:tRNA lysidine(34) synthetase TilS [Paenirhodobacter hankyongi]|uniref:tRNA lysidine(34) synthetase TilS n=1 Tax=Paenirhodobacter hankyongi TaxID=2294033 RepID=UPI001FE355DE|nr:tRNA lysidine(34) synthetase TilS [Sinirhodobacter hankyongi]
MTPDLTALLKQAFGPDAPPRVGVAVSGGGDSTALLVGLREAGFDLAAVTVDHGLRAGSAEEAAEVGRLCAGLGVPHSVLSWEGTAAEGNLMDAARRARLRLIGAWAWGQGIGHVALGHTADDEAETFLMRLGREAGLEGLAGMRRRFVAEGVTWHRPLLDVSRADLRAALRARGLGWIDDPSNDNPRFGRVRARQALATLAPLGITPATLGAVVRNLAAADAVLSETLCRFVEAAVTTPAGDVVIAREGVEALAPELQRRLLNAALRWISGSDYPPRAAKVAALLAGLAEQGDRTLHGCRIRIGRDALRLTREAAAVAALRVPAGERWDRWDLTGPAAPGLEIAALGEGGLALCPHWRETGLPRASLLASPAVWSGARLIAAPLAGLENGWKAQIACGAFAESLIRR